MSKGITASEAIARLNADPEYLEMRRQKEAELNDREDKLKLEQASLIADLKAVGWNVSSVWELVNTSKNYHTAIPILLHHLTKPYSDGIREGIARALAVRSAASVWMVLRDEYQVTPSGSGYKNGLAVALRVTSSEDVIDELALMALNSKNGSSRLHLLKALKSSPSLIARDTLRKLENDPELKEEILSWSKGKKG